MLFRVLKKGMPHSKKHEIMQACSTLPLLSSILWVQLIFVSSFRQDGSHQLKPYQVHILEQNLVGPICCIVILQHNNRYTLYSNITGRMSAISLINVPIGT